jgi:hypothetical protein
MGTNFSCIKVQAETYDIALAGDRRSDQQADPNSGDKAPPKLEKAAVEKPKRNGDRFDEEYGWREFDRHYQFYQDQALLPQWAPTDWSGEHADPEGDDKLPTRLRREFDHWGKLCVDPEMLWLAQERNGMRNPVDSLERGLTDKRSGAPHDRMHGLGRHAPRFRLHLVVNDCIDVYGRLQLQGGPDGNLFLKEGPEEMAQHVANDAKQRISFMLDSFQEYALTEENTLANAHHKDFFNLLSSIQQTNEYEMDVDRTMIRRIIVLVPILYADAALRALCFGECSAIRQRHAHSGELMLQSIEDLVLPREVESGLHKLDELACAGHRNFRRRVLLARRDMPKLVQTDFHPSSAKGLRGADMNPAFIDYLTQWTPWIAALKRENPGKFEMRDASEHAPLLEALTKDYLRYLADVAKTSGGFIR